MRNDTPRTFIGTTAFTVTGMTGADCERALTSEISGIAGVSTVNVDLATGLVTVTAGAPVDRANIARGVALAGYTMRP